MRASVTARLFAPQTTPRAENEIRTAGSRRRERQRLKSGPWTVEVRDLMRMWVMTSGLLSVGLNWYLCSSACGLLDETRSLQLENGKVGEQVVFLVFDLAVQVLFHETQVCRVVSIYSASVFPHTNEPRFLLRASSRNTGCRRPSSKMIPTNSLDQLLDNIRPGLWRVPIGKRFRCDGR
jgi:hypothetical protein